MFHLPKYFIISILNFLIVFGGLITFSIADERDSVPQMPMPVNYEETADFRWLNKPVLETKLLDDMENPANWIHRGQGDMLFIKERFVDGWQSVRLRFPTSQFDNPSKGGGASVFRNFNGEDWRDYNRLSFWVYPTFPGFYTIPMVVILHNDGTIKVPDKYGRSGKNFLIIQPNQWNHIVWEIANVERDKITSVELAYHLHSHEPGAADTAWFDFDRLELQKVNADHYEGWNVAPGQITFSHTGYQTGASKSAFASALSVQEFSLINTDNNKVVLTKPVQTIKTHLGQYQLMDFSEIRDSGTYYIKAGNVKTRTFKISDNVWRESIWKTINFFYCERCGFEIPGSHSFCHGDVQAVNGDKKVITNGGWHDAGDLSQGVTNTGEATYAMFSLAERVKETDPVLYKRLIEEARWGLNWVLRGRFGNGYRHIWQSLGFWTDGIIGTKDDRTFEARPRPWENFIAASLEALAYSILKNSDTILAAYSLKAAQEDWQSACDNIKKIDIEITSAGALASIDLYNATHDQKYADKAVEFANVILNSQQREYPEWNIPLTGFFYTGPEKIQILRYDHRSSGQAPMVALAKLCKSLPDHPNWMKWYSAIVLNSEYSKTISQFSQPYGMLPSSVYAIDEMDRPPVPSVYSGEFIPAKYLKNESEEPAYKAQLLNGIKVGENHYLKFFPVFYGHRGNHGVLLSDTKALSSAAQVRGDLELTDLCQRQLEWVVGRNPFCQSTMYGEGYDYASQYTPTSGNMVGSLPVGVRTRENNDLPYWPPWNCYNFKEVYVHPSSRWLWLMEDLAGPARISGLANSGADQQIEFREVQTGKSITAKVEPNTGKFNASLPEGKYLIRSSQQQRQITLLPGAAYNLDLRQPFDFTVSEETSGDGAVTIKVTAEGNSHAKFTVRFQNLTIDNAIKEVDLKMGTKQEFSYNAKIINVNEPWVAVIIPDDKLSEKKEISGGWRRK